MLFLGKLETCFLLMDPIKWSGGLSSYLLFNHLSVCLCSAAHTDSHINGMAQCRRTQPSCKAPTPSFFSFFFSSLLYPWCHKWWHPNLQISLLPTWETTSQQSDTHCDNHAVTEADRCVWQNTDVHRIIMYSYLDESSLPKQRLLFLCWPTCTRTVSSQILSNKSNEGCDGKQPASDSASSWGSSSSHGGLCWGLVWRRWNVQPPDR